MQGTIIIFHNVDLHPSVLLEHLVHELSPLIHLFSGKVDNFTAVGRIHLSRGGTNYKGLVQYLLTLVGWQALCSKVLIRGAFHLTDQTTSRSNHIDFDTLSTSHDISCALRLGFILSEGCVPGKHLLCYRFVLLMLLCNHLWYKLPGVLNHRSNIVG